MCHYRRQSKVVFPQDLERLLRLPRWLSDCVRGGRHYVHLWHECTRSECVPRRRLPVSLWEGDRACHKQRWFMRNGGKWCVHVVQDSRWVFIGCNFVIFSLTNLFQGWIMVRCVTYIPIRNHKDHWSFLTKCRGCIWSHLSIPLVHTQSL